MAGPLINEPSMDAHHGGHGAECDAALLNEGYGGADGQAQVTLTRWSAEPDFKVAFRLTGGDRLDCARSLPT